MEGRFFIKLFNAETQRRVTAAQAGLAIRSEPSREYASAESTQRGFSRVEYATG